MMLRAGFAQQEFHIRKNGKVIARPAITSAFDVKVKLSVSTIIHTMHATLTTNLIK